MPLYPAWIPYRLDRALGYLLITKGRHQKFRYACELTLETDVLNSFRLLCLASLGEFAEAPSGDSL